MKESNNLDNQPNQSEMAELENLFKLNELDTLEKKTKNLINNYPQIPILYNILGVVLQKKNSPHESILNFNKAISIQPNFYQAHNNLGNVLKDLGKFKDALSSYEKALKINPNYAEGYSNLGNTLSELGEFKESVIKLKKALQLYPDNPDFHVNLGSSLAELGEYDEAVINFEKALKINPNYAEAYSNLGNVLADLEKYDEAIANQERALKLNPEYKKANFNEAMIRLSLEEFEIGWKKYEFRLGKNSVVPMRYSVEKIWNGKYLNGTLFVWGEQGIGDYILFASMITELAKCSKNIILEIDSRLENLFKRYLKEINCSNIKLIGSEKKLEYSFDKHVPIGSLGQYFRNTKESFKQTPIKYLITSSLKENEYKKKFLKNNNFKIGISWKTLNKKQKFRNIDLKEMLPILSIPECDFISLQFGKFEDEVKYCNSKFNTNIRLINEIDNFYDLDGFATLINCLDLIVTIQNSTAHISGALGKKTYVMVTKTGTSKWHWLEKKKKSIWYPSLTIFKQKKMGDWNTVTDDITTNLKKLIKNIRTNK